MTNKSSLIQTSGKEAKKSNISKQNTDYLYARQLSEGILINKI